MGIYDEQVDVYFDDAHLARDALHRAGGAGDGVACRVITRQPDEDVRFGDLTVVRPTTLIDVRISEVAAPAEGDTFTIGASVYTVTGAPRRDAERLVWTCGCRSA